MLRSRSRVFVVAFVLASLPLCGKADGEATLTIRLATPFTQFKVGQVGPLALTFSALDADTYTFNTASYDRSGRLETEQFEVTPKGRDHFMPTITTD